MIGSAKRKEEHLWSVWKTSRLHLAKDGREVTVITILKDATDPQRFQEKESVKECDDVRVIELFELQGLFKSGIRRAFIQAQVHFHCHEVTSGEVFHEIHFTERALSQIQGLTRAWFELPRYADLEGIKDCEPHLCAPASPHATNQCGQSQHS